MLPYPLGPEDTCHPTLMAETYRRSFAGSLKFPVEHSKDANQEVLRALLNWEKQELVQCPESCPARPCHEVKVLAGQNLSYSPTASAHSHSPQGSDRPKGKEGACLRPAPAWGRWARIPGSQARLVLTVVSTCHLWQVPGSPPHSAFHCPEGRSEKPAPSSLVCSLCAPPSPSPILIDGL